MEEGNLPVFCNEIDNSKGCDMHILPFNSSIFSALNIIDVLYQVFS